MSTTDLDPAISSSDWTPLRKRHTLDGAALKKVRSPEFLTLRTRSNSVPSPDSSPSVPRRMRSYTVSLNGRYTVEQQPSSAALVELFWGFFRARNSEKNYSKKLSLRGDVAFKAKRLSSSGAGGCGQSPGSRLSISRILELIQRAHHELSSSGQIAADHTFRTVDDESFTLSLLLDQMVQHPWVQGAFKHHYQLREDYLKTLLEHRLQGPLQQLSRESKTFLQAKPMLTNLALLAGVTDDYVEVKSDWGIINGMELIGIVPPADSSTDSSMCTNAERTLEKLIFNETYPHKAFSEYCRTQIQLQPTNTQHWKEVLARGDLADIERFLSTPFLQYTQRRHTAVSFIRKLFNQYCDQSYLLTYHADCGKADIQPEHKAWNAEAKKILRENGYPKFLRDREYVNSVFEEYQANKGSAAAILDSLEAFLQRYPGPPRRVKGADRLGTPLPRNIQRYSDGSIDPRSSANERPTSEHLRQTEEWSRWKT